MDKLILSELTNGLNTVWMLLAAMLVLKLSVSAIRSLPAWMFLAR